MREDKLKAHQQKGIFWFPDKPSVQFAGVLEIDSVEGFILEAIGFLSLFSEIDETAEALPQSEGREMPIGSTLGTEIIHGVTEEGREVTLLDCLYGRNTIASGYTATRISARKVFEGYHFQNRDQIKFENVSIHYSNLEKWVGISGFRSSIKWSDETGFISQHVDYTLIDPIEYHLSALIVRFVFSFKSTLLAVAEAPMSETIEIEIKRNRQTHLADYEVKLQLIRNFLILGMGQTTIPTCVRAHHEDHKEQRDDGKVIYQSDVTIHSPRDNMSISANEDLDATILFYYRDISDNLEVYLGNWLEKADMLKPVYDLYFSKYYTPFMYAEEEFLTLARAVEAYHRRVYSGNMTFKKRIVAILSDRLQPYSEVVKKIAKDTDEFAEKVKEARNYQTHQNPKENHKWFSGQRELVDYINKLRLVLQLCFFVELEFSPDLVGEITSQNELFKRYMK